MTSKSIGIMESSCQTSLSSLSTVGPSNIPTDQQTCAKKYEPFHEKNKILDSALSIDPDQSKHNAQVTPDRHFSPPLDFRLQESILHTSILLKRNVSTRNSLCGLHRLIWVDTLYRVDNVGFLMERLI